MAFWRQLSTVLFCSLMIGGLGVCTPASNSPLNEEKDPHVVKGRNREAGYDFPGAIESYHRALELNPRNSVAHSRLGLLYEREDRDPAAAIYHLQQHLALRPNSGHADVIRQRILGCKQSLAKDVVLGPLSVEMQERVNNLIEKNQTLTEENKRLEEQLARVQRGFIPGAPPAVTPSPPPPTQPATPTPAPQRPVTGKTHTVQNGDTYYSIARRYGISSTSLQLANPGVDPNRLKIGQRLSFPDR